MKRLLACFIILAFGTSSKAADADRKGLDFFEAKIRPVLIKHCYECHSAEAVTKKNLKGGLFLDSRAAGLKGGESGPAVVPGKPDESLLIGALKHESFEMPPKGKLPDEIIADFETWIKMGAPDPREGESVNAPATTIDIEAGRKHWSFQPLTQPTPPAVNDMASVRNPIDQFILAKQQTANVTPNNVAAARTLIRRAYFDLTGLPPEIEEVNQFVEAMKGDSTTAYEQLIDKLLSSKHFGERWARHWLDIVRFAESNGYAFDGDRPNAWHYRDFVIRALNADMPYDQFVKLQIAGDLLTDTNVQTTDEANAAINKVAATGFVVAGPFTTQQTQKERERSRYEQLDDIVNTMGTSLLGLTVGCSRCHSHKFDPLPQFDYYRLASCFADVGFSNTGINSKPEQYQQATKEFQATHTPLVAARTKYEQEQLPEQFENWLGTHARPAAGEALTLGDWYHSGPFSAENFQQAFDKAFEPEKAIDVTATGDDQKPKWTQQPDWVDGQVHNTFSTEIAANYIYRTIESPKDQILSLSLGSDDGIKVWVNGKEVLAKLVGRGAAPDQEAIQVPLQKGANQLLIKVVNAGGPSGFYFAATPLANRPLPTINAWLHVGPFTAANFDVAFNKVFPPERDTNLERTFQKGKLNWVEQPEWKDGIAHNDKLKGANSANYLYRVIESDKPQVLLLSLGSDDGIKLWVNGRQQLAKKVTRNVAKAGQETQQIQLAAGRNEILIKIVNSGGATGFYFDAKPAPQPKEITAILNIEAAKWDDKQKKQIVDWHKGYDLPWLQLNQTVARNNTKRPKPNLTHVYAARVKGSTYQFGDDTFKVYHLRRGNADNKEDLANPGFLQVLMRNDTQEKNWLTDPAKSETMRPGRLGLADWLTDVDNGSGHLLARVIVNRLWHHHFGRGIVATPSDFGTRGEAPSHPELLDWLASELIRNDWKLKPIHKLILTSATYMQSGNVTESNRQIDPENLLLWRRNARRLEAEVIRDSLLAASNTLDRTMFGKGTLDNNSKRRSLYFTVKRSQIIRMMQLFDFPDTMQGIGAREESTVAPQALTFLNSSIIRELAGQLAKRVRPNADVSIEQAINNAYEICFSRPATNDEQQAMTAFIQKQKTQRAVNKNNEDKNSEDEKGKEEKAESLALRDFCHLVLCMNEFVYVD